MITDNQCARPPTSMAFISIARDTPGLLEEVKKHSHLPTEKLSKIAHEWDTSYSATNTKDIARNCYSVKLDIDQAFCYLKHWQCVPLRWYRDNDKNIN